MRERGVKKRVHTHTHEREGGLNSLAGGGVLYYFPPTRVEVPCAPEEQPEWLMSVAWSARRRANMYPPWTFSLELLAFFLPSPQSAQKVQESKLGVGGTRICLRMIGGEIAKAGLDVECHKQLSSHLLTSWLAGSTEWAPLMSHPTELWKRPPWGAQFRATAAHPPRRSTRRAPTATVVTEVKRGVVKTWPWWVCG